MMTMHEQRKQARDQNSSVEETELSLWGLLAQMSMMAQKT
jgi:hypothetical protein